MSKSVGFTSNLTDKRVPSFASSRAVSLFHCFIMGTTVEPVQRASPPPHVDASSSSKSYKLPAVTSFQGGYCRHTNLVCRHTLYTPSVPEVHNSQSVLFAGRLLLYLFFLLIWRYMS